MKPFRRILTGKKILLGVCGGIAAYKIPGLLRRLIKEGAEVRVVLTEGAEAFITPLTFEALCREKVFCQCDFLNPPPGCIPHTELGAFAEAILVAPATASFLASLASGDARSLLVATILASRAPVLLFPAMNTKMWEHPAVKENVKKIASWGYKVFTPEEGALACGEWGPGRLPEEEIILAHLEKTLALQDFSNCKVLITAGPTREPLDAVRFLSNRSSGRMGVALAEAAWKRGAEVILVHGPLSSSPLPLIRRIPVETAAQMAEAVLSLLPKVDILLMAAAVADYRPQDTWSGKLKKTSPSLTISLERTPDILKEVSSRRKPGQVIVGFAAEEEEFLPQEARRKLKEKGLDLIVANPIDRPETGFESATNEVFLFFADGRKIHLPLAPKDVIAWQILDAIKELQK